MVSIKFIYNFIPIPVFYTDRVKEGFGGASYGLWIKIRPKYKDDDGLLAHELTHCKQWCRTLGIHGIMTFISDGWRYKSEVEAYAIQCLTEHSVVSQRAAARLAATSIANKYKLDVDEMNTFHDICKKADI